MYRHYRCAAKQSAHFYPVTYGLAGGRDNTNGGGLGIDHTDSRLVCNNCRNGCCAGIAGHGNHIQAHGAYAGHSFQLI